VDPHGAPPVSETLLAFQTVRKEFLRPGGDASIVAIENVSFQLHAKEFVSVVGPSGCGKTTLLRMAAGMTEPTAGSLQFAGGKRDGTTGFVFQHASLFPWRTIGENVAYGLELARNRRRASLSRADVQRRVDDLLELVGLADFGRFYPPEISGGMQQRCNLARALAIRPDLLLMDEPFSALDAQTREELQLELQRIATELGTTILFITHDIREAAFLSDRVVVLSKRPSTVVEIVDVPTPRPRQFDYQVSNEFNSIMRSLFELVH
jgi:NitT/TauT family transport system ATP-binding protein